jgi:putative addiction module killer protein
MTESDEWELSYYQTASGRVPFREWELSLSDARVSRAVGSRLRRLRRGLLGDCKSVGEGVLEFRLDLGPGYRGYFFRSGVDVILLLCGGEKSTQAGDIEAAKRYRRDYEQRTRGTFNTL